MVLMVLEILHKNEYNGAIKAAVYSEAAACEGKEYRKFSTELVQDDKGVYHTNMAKPHTNLCALLLHTQ